MIGVGLYGSFGHQIHHLMPHHPRARLVAVAQLSPAHLETVAPLAPHRYNTLAELLADPDVQLVSLCSPRRQDQARQAIQALEAGKHVYAEKPCALTEPELDAILAAARRANRHFHEMAGTAFEQPYLAMRRIVQSGCLGPILQIVAQKCYPFGDWRPQDETIDGGLLLQVGVHAARMVEHVGLRPVQRVQGWETRLGNPDPAGQLRRAGMFTMELEGGGLAAATANYCNPPGTGIWGYESLILYGLHGLVESHRGGQITRLVIGNQDLGPLDLSTPARDYFEYFLDLLEGVGPMPLTLEEELHPTRIVLRAKASLHP